MPTMLSSGGQGELSARQNSIANTRCGTHYHCSIYTEHTVSSMLKVWQAVLGKCIPLSAKLAHTSLMFLRGSVLCGVKVDS